MAVLAGLQPGLELDVQSALAQLLDGVPAELLADLGAYAGIVGGGTPVLGAWMYNSIYKFPAYRFNTTNLYTNKTWVDAYRGAGRPEATFAIERIMDELAAEVGFPAGAINIVPGDGPTTGAYLVRHPGVDKVAFTGSTKTGGEIMRL